MKYILFLAFTVVILSCGSGEKSNPKSDIMPLADLATLSTAETYYAANGDTVVLTKVRKTFFYDSTIKTVKPFKGTQPPPPPPPPPTPTTRQNISFDPGTNISSWPVIGTATNYGITSTTFAGKAAYRFEVRKSDPPFAGGVRAELNRYSDLTTGYPYEVWYGMSYYIPTDWINDHPLLTDVVSQWHDEGGSLKSPFDFNISAGNWMFQTRSNAGEAQTTIGAVEKGKWTDFVFHLKFVRSGTGIVEIWKNGVKVISQTPAMGYSSATIPPFFKMGIYKWPWNPNSGQTTASAQHNLYIANFRLGNAKATYADVAP